MIQSIYLYRHYFRYLPLFVWAIFLFACSDDSLVQKPEGTMETVSVTIQTRAGAMELIPANETNEYKIETLRLYVFGVQKELLGYYYVSNPTVVENMVTFTLKLPTGIHTFYAIANEGAAGELKKNNSGVKYTFPEPTTDGTEVNLESISITPDELESLTFSQLPEAIPAPENPEGADETTKKYTSPLLPMVSKYIQQVTPNGSVSIPLTRSVAKMKFYFTTTGAGECYIGRGIYLYNEPEYGYLFPREAYDVTIGRKEADSAPSDWKTNPNYKDSHLHQLNGRIILNSGWPDEPAELEDHTQGMEKLDINLIKADMNDPLNPQYHNLPNKSFYLFANPHQIGKQGTVSSTKPEVNAPNGYGEGYYLKILVHQHGAGQTGAELHKGERFYLCLPAVKANDRLSVYSVVTLDGHVSLTPHWMVQEWQTGGGDIEFN